MSSCKESLNSFQDILIIRDFAGVSSSIGKGVNFKYR